MLTNYAVELYTEKKINTCICIVGDEEKNKDYTAREKCGRGGGRLGVDMLRRHGGGGKT